MIILIKTPTKADLIPMSPNSAAEYLAKEGMDPTTPYQQTIYNDYDAALFAKNRYNELLATPDSDVTAIVYADNNNNLKPLQ